MATIRILGLAFCLFVTVSAKPRRTWYEDNVERELEDLRRRQLFECKAKFEQCSGYPKCCGDLHCFWEGGYSPLRSGVCSECIDRTQPCQMTEQCCSPLVCQRENAYHVNGVCDVKRALLAECHKDSQCESGYCDIGWPERIKGQGGKCRNRQSRRTYLFDDDEEK